MMSLAVFSCRKSRFLTVLIVLIMLAVSLTACDALPFSLPFGGSAELAIATGVSDANGVARVESAAGVNDFQVSSGLTGERLEGIRIRVAVFGDTRMLIAEDPTGRHFPVAVPLTGEATVRRLVLPGATATGYNLTSATGTLDLRDLTEIEEPLSEAAMRDRLNRGADEAVLLYMYNPTRPLALTGASLSVYETPFNNVYVLRAPGEPDDTQLAFVVVAMNDTAYAGWSNLPVDRYLAGRIGQSSAGTDLRGDLAFNWSYPVYDMFPADQPLEAGESEEVMLRVNWRSQNPDPPPPWSFFVSSEDANIAVEPEAFSLGPDSPPAEVTVTIDREGLAVGDYEATVFIQPYSDAFGMIEQSLEYVIAYTVGQAEPTATPGPSLDSLSVEPEEPRVGQQMTVTAGGFTPEEPVLFELIGQEHSVSDSLQLADEEGNFTYVVDLSLVPAGSYTLRVTGSESGVTGEQTLNIGESIPDAVVVSGELNLRTGPGYDYPAVDILVSGDELTVVAVNWDDTWLEVQTGTGNQGWVVTDLVELNISLENVPWNSNFPNPDLSP